MMRLILDTNVVVRFLVSEPRDQAAAATRLFELCDARKLILVFEPLVVAEVIFVLTSFYKRSRAEIASAMERILSSPGLECGRRPETEKALRHYRTSTVHWVDCFLAATSEISGSAVASFDRDFDSLAGAARVDPEAL